MRKFLRKMQSAARKASAPEQFSLARKLAVIQSSGYVPENDPLVKKFATALGRLAQAAQVPEMRAADVTVRTHELAAGRRTLVEIVTDLHDSIPDGGLKGVKFEELAGAYLTAILAPPRLVNDLVP